MLSATGSAMPVNIACVFVLMLTVGISAVTKRGPKCDQESLEYFTLKRCVSCDKCPTGQGRDTSTKILFDGMGRPLNCYKCMDCAQGMYNPPSKMTSDVSEFDTCLDCMVCSEDNRKVQRNCSSSSGTVCGDCLDNYYDYYGELDPESRNTCRHCRFADENEEACKQYHMSKTSDEAVKNLTTWPGILVFSLVVGLAIFTALLTYVVKVWRSRHVGYRGLSSGNAGDRPGSDDNLTCVSSEDGGQSEPTQRNRAEGKESELQTDVPDSSSQPKQVDTFPSPALESASGPTISANRSHEDLLGAIPWDVKRMAMNQANALVERTGAEADGPASPPRTIGVPRCRRRYSYEHGTAVNGDDGGGIPLECVGSGRLPATSCCNGASEETEFGCRRRLQRSVSCPEGYKSTTSLDGASGCIVGEEGVGHQDGAAQAEEVISDEELVMVRDRL